MQTLSPALSEDLIRRQYRKFLRRAWMISIGLILAVVVTLWLMPPLGKVLAVIVGVLIPLDFATLFCSFERFRDEVGPRLGLVDTTAHRD
jgi:Flp pilus assembly protein TadB